MRRGSQAGPLSWQIVPYEGRSPFKKVRVRDDGRVRDVLRHLQNHECVALIGSPFSEKTALLNDVASALEATGRYVALNIDLWQITSEDEASFFTSLARMIDAALRSHKEIGDRRLEMGNLEPKAPYGHSPISSLQRIPDAHSFQNFLSAVTDAQPGHLVLLIDHLQALPHDLVHSLLLALRAAYMERPVDAPRQLVAVVTGGMNLVGLSTGATSPFNIARPVVAAPLTPEQSLALAQATLAADGLPASAAGLQRIVEWAGGDRYEVPLLCAQAVGLVQGYRRGLVDRRAVDRAASQLFLAGAGSAPVREAIRMIEEDPDTILDVLHLLQHGSLARSRARQMPTRTGADRLQLSGAVVLAENSYALKNLAYRSALARHFTAERVGHILRIAGRWHEAIAYLGPQVAQARGAQEIRESAAPRESASGSRVGVEAGPGATPTAAGRGVNGAGTARGVTAPETRPYALAAEWAQWDAAQAQLLEATVQSIYAADSLPAAWELLARGLEQGFGLTGVAVYRAIPAAGRLELAYPQPAIAGTDAGDPTPSPPTPLPEGKGTHGSPLPPGEGQGRPPEGGGGVARSDAKPPVISLDDPDSVEARAFAYGSYALRGTRGATRLVAVLREASRNRRLGVVTVEHYVEVRDPHELPGQLPELLHFLEHAAGAIENVMIRSAYRAIGQAVLDSGTFRPTLERVLLSVADGLGCDAANLYLLDPGQAMLEMVAGTGRPYSPEWQALARYSLGGDHPAAACLRGGRVLVAPGTDQRFNRALADRFGLRRYTWAYLPLAASGQPLGTLELGYAEQAGILSDPRSRANLTAFANQVAIAVHNAQLLRRTDEQLARRVVELEKLRSSSLAISATLDVPTVLRRIIRDLRTLFPGSEATVWEYNRSRGELRVLQSSLTDPDYLAQRLSVDSLNRRAAANGQVQSLEDLSALLASQNDAVERLGLRETIAVPLISHQTVLGAIDLYSYAEGSTPPLPVGEGAGGRGVADPSTAELLRAFAAHAAVAIENARLHEEELARQRLEQELAVAREIQRTLLPDSAPQVPGWEFAAAYQAARVVGGDFYDFCEPPGDPPRIGIVVADVTDKGVPAAIFMALSRTIIRTMAMGGGRSPASVLTHANRLILNDSTSDYWLTAVYAALEPASGRLTYANAGHCRPLWYRAAVGNAVELGARGIVLGTFDNIRLEEERIDLAPGDALVFFTDGITEAASPSGELFGDERLMAAFCNHASGSADEILSGIMDAVAVFTSGAEQADDITCVVIKRA